MIYLIYLICSTPLIVYLETRSTCSFIGKALSTMNLFEKIMFYSVVPIKEFYVLLHLIELKKPEWFTIKNDF